jgi:hypothetical protein
MSPPAHVHPRTPHRGWSWTSPGTLAAARPLLLLATMTGLITLAWWPSQTGPTLAAETTCAGDCNGDGEVTIDEIITGVNIALGLVGLQNCAAFEANADGEVTIDEPKSLDSAFVRPVYG